MIVHKCIKCRTPINSRDEQAGDIVECGFCAYRNIVPGEKPRAPEPPPPQPDTQLPPEQPPVQPPLEQPDAQLEPAETTELDAERVVADLITPAVEVDGQDRLDAMAGVFVRPPPLPASQEPWSSLAADAGSFSDAGNPGLSSAVRYPRLPPPMAPSAMPALVLGVMSVMMPCLGVVLAIVAIVLGSQATSAIRQSKGKLGGHGNATAGIVLGIIAISVHVVVLLAAV